MMHPTVCVSRSFFGKQRKKTRFSLDVNGNFYGQWGGAGGGGWSKPVWPRGQRQSYCCICAAGFHQFSLSAVGVVALPSAPPLCAS